MHHCLEIPELVEHIALQFDSSESLGSLAAFARTTRSFQGPALDVLWRTQNTLKNLLKTMPSDLFKEEIITGKRILASSAYLVSDWEPTRPYANRVKHFESIYSQDDISYSSLFPILALSLPSDCIFPNLTHIHWIRLNDDFPHIRLLLGPQVVAIRTQCASATSLSLLSLLPRKCPLLTHVAISLPNINPGSELTAATTRSLSEFIRELHSIEHWDIHIPDMAALQHIAQLPSLHSLDVHSLPPALSASRLDGDALFPSLRHLHITEESSISSTIHFVEMCADATLETCIVEIQFYTPPAFVERILGTLAASHRTSLIGLRIVMMVRSMMEEVDEDHHMFTIDNLLPALDLHNLRQIDLKSKLGFDFDDMAVSKMARAWPKLRSLDITEVDHAPGGVRTTFESLLHFARHCPELASLGMAFSTTNIPPLDQTPLPHRHLRYLDVKHSSFISASAEVGEIANFLSTVFPNLREVVTAEDSVRDEDGLERRRKSSKWEEVRALLRA
ncbi:hypothetical protein FB45DRAFT_1102295 [Roridomyces roridus]|uniref:F-box domain-containing protein n=1 Tax=Roridomyces roridus TaxID=1738132 RepID=A0AAD7G0L8_9AGAR|nr:hypothetical protein FB45DRAFT_1102295 [Roridomyces roridus]